MFWSVGHTVDVNLVHHHPGEPLVGGERLDLTVALGLLRPELAGGSLRTSTRTDIGA